jgi:nucleoside transporter
VFTNFCRLDKFCVSLFLSILKEYIFQQREISKNLFDMKSGVFAKLSVMMLLEYFVWGAWYVTLGTYMSTFLNPSGLEIGLAFGALAVATMISPFFVGMVADRYFSAQKIMGVLHIGGAVLLIAATLVGNSIVFIGVVFLYSLLYMPTIALSNSIAFQQMTDPGKQFPWIRVFGTLGWIAAGLLMGMLGIEKTPSTFYMAAIASATLGLFSFILPNTPPKGSGDGSATSEIRYADAFVLFKDKSYLVFFIAAVLVCIPLSFYYGFANVFLNDIKVDQPASKMILGQVSEAIFILAIPFLFNSIGVKKMLLIGIVAWILRYVCFAFGNVDSGMWMLYGGIILHGVCYDFFFVTGYMYTEKKAGEKIKSAAQGLFTFATYGLGMVIGTVFSGFVTDYYTVGNVKQWESIWLVPVYIATAVLLYFVVFFREKK